MLANNNVSDLNASCLGFEQKPHFTSPFLPVRPSSPMALDDSSSDESTPSSASSIPSVTDAPLASLSQVPLDYIREQLRLLASKYWNQSETADCVILIPIPQPRVGASTDVMPPVASNHDPAGRGRRVTEPATPALRQLTMRLHMDYVSYHSSLIRSLFSGNSPLDLAPHTRTLPSVPPSRAPRVFPSATVPTIYLPVPDPSSIYLLVHYMYFRSTIHIQEALDAGVVHWQGVALNVEYLGMEYDLKVFLGGYWGRYSGTTQRGLSVDSHRDHHPDPDDADDEHEDDMDCEEEDRGRPITTHRRRST